MQISFSSGSGSDHARRFAPKPTGGPPPKVSPLPPTLDASLRASIPVNGGDFPVDQLLFNIGGEQVGKTLSLAGGLPGVKVRLTGRFSANDFEALTRDTRSPLGKGKGCYVLTKPGGQKVLAIQLVS